VLSFPPRCVIDSSLSISPLLLNSSSLCSRRPTTNNNIAAAAAAPQLSPPSVICNVLVLAALPNRA